MNILALDIALNTGWAFGDGTPQGTVYGTHTFAGIADYGNLSWLFSDWLADKLTEDRPDLVAIERGFFRGPQSYHLSGLIWDAHRICWLRSVPRLEVPPSSIKKSFTGNARATKEDMTAAAFSRGFKPRNDHEADAIALLLLAKERASQKEAA